MQSRKSVQEEVKNERIDITHPSLQKKDHRPSLQFKKELDKKVASRIQHSSNSTSKQRQGLSVYIRKFRTISIGLTTCFLLGIIGFGVFKGGFSTTQKNYDEKREVVSIASYPMTTRENNKKAAEKMIQTRDLTTSTMAVPTQSSSMITSTINKSGQSKKTRPVFISSIRKQIQQRGEQKEKST